MDDELRRAERLGEGGSVADDARLLHAHLRAGQLPAESLELAADLGHGPASEALGRPVATDRPKHPWTRGVHEALARRLLSRRRPSPLDLRSVTYQGPEGTNDGSRFALPPTEELRAAIGQADTWEVRGVYGEGEVALVLRAGRAQHPDPAELWIDLALAHEVLGAPVAKGTAEGLARFLLAHPHDVARVSDPLGAAACCSNGFASARTRAGFRRLLGPGPILRAYRICDLWNEVTDVLETESSWLLAHWETSA